MRLSHEDKDHIAQQILQLVEADQQMRSQWASHGFSPEHYNKNIDEANQRQVTEILSRIGGWPTVTEFSSEVADSLWVLVQHAPDISFQQMALRAMQALPSSEVNTRNIAKTTDRILRRDGKKQLYGTSFTINVSDNTLHVDPIEDEGRIDERRAALGLDSFADQKARAFASFREHVSATSQKAA